MQSKRGKNAIRFGKAANKIIFAINAKPAKPAESKRVKSAEDKLTEDVAILKGLARAYLATNHAALKGAASKENGREVVLNGNASDGVAIIACASLLAINADTAHAGDRIKLTNKAEGHFSEAAKRAIGETINTLQSSIDLPVEFMARPKEIPKYRNPSL